MLIPELTSSCLVSPEKPSHTGSHPALTPGQGQLPRTRAGAHATTSIPGSLCRRCLQMLLKNLVLSHSDRVSHCRNEVTKTQRWHTPASSHVALSCLVCSQAVSHPTPPLQARCGRTSKAKPDQATRGFPNFRVVKPYPEKTSSHLCDHHREVAQFAACCYSHKPFNGS